MSVWEGEGIPVPLGADEQPVATMRTTAHPRNMSVGDEPGTDPRAFATQAGHPRAGQAARRQEGGEHVSTAATALGMHPAPVGSAPVVPKQGAPAQGAGLKPRGR